MNLQNLTIEPFSLSDLDSISNILENEFDNFWNYQILKNELKNENCLYLVCKIDNEIIGFAGITIILDVAELNNIVIKKSKRGNGLSTILLNEIIKNAKLNNCKELNLEVAICNEIAINLYKKFGFKQVGLRKKYYNGIDALLFTKLLDI